VLREDAGFQAYQILEVRVRQFNEWDDDAGAGRYILIGVSAIWRLVHPTERATLQTADIARRLMRGGELHQEAGDVIQPMIPLVFYDQRTLGRTVGSRRSVSAESH
jgi:hypothetical protein